MKIGNWYRRFAMTLIAGGILAPTSAHAANLGVNLVVNGDFENVNLATTGEYNSPLVLDWIGPNLFAYSHDGSSSATGVVPDYADGADPPGAGHWYFTPNNTGGAPFTSVFDPDVYYQDISLSSGATATAIAAGAAQYDLSAYMTSYLNDTDFGNVRAEFRNAASAPVGSVTISDTADAGPNNVWSLVGATGMVPVDAASVRVSLWGTRTAGGEGADGYTDNVDFRIRAIPEPSTGALAALGAITFGWGTWRRRREP
jgi:hypothetical protein